MSIDDIKFIEYLLDYKILNINDIWTHIINYAAINNKLNYINNLAKYIDNKNKYINDGLIQSINYNYHINVIKALLTIYKGNLNIEEIINTIIKKINQFIIKLDNQSNIKLDIVYNDLHNKYKNEHIIEILNLILEDTRVTKYDINNNIEFLSKNINIYKLMVLKNFTDIKLDNVEYIKLLKESIKHSNDEMFENIILLEKVNIRDITEDIIKNVYKNKMIKSANILAKSNNLRKYIMYHIHMDLASKYGYFEIIIYILENEEYSVNYYNKLFDIAFESGDEEILIFLFELFPI